MKSKLNQEISIILKTFQKNIIVFSIFLLIIVASEVSRNFVNLKHIYIFLSSFIEILLRVNIILFLINYNNLQYSRKCKLETVIAIISTMIILYFLSIFSKGFAVLNAIMLFVFMVTIQYINYDNFHYFKISIKYMKKHYKIILLSLIIYFIIFSTGLSLMKSILIRLCYAIFKNRILAINYLYSFLNIEFLFLTMILVYKYRKRLDKIFTIKNLKVKITKKIRKI
jgi:hypothetical protein